MFFTSELTFIPCLKAAMPGIGFPVRKICNQMFVTPLFFGTKGLFFVTFILFVGLV